MLTVIKVWLLLNMLLMSIVLVKAQEPQPAPQLPSPMEQAVSIRLGREINAALSCEATVISLQRQLQEASVKLKAQEKTEKQSD